MMCPHGSNSTPQSCSQCLGYNKIKTITIVNGETRVNGRKPKTQLYSDLTGRDLIALVNQSTFNTAKRGRKRRERAAQQRQEHDDDEQVLDEEW